jgi:hypothetical protein
MRATPKYKAKAVFFDSIKRVVIDSNEIDKYRTKGRVKLPDGITRFDSQHEFKVYLELCRMYGERRVIRQYPIELITPGVCYPKGKVWKVDFAVTSFAPRDRNIHFVEAKGAFLTEFGYTLVNLEITQPDIFAKLCIIFSRSIPTESRVVKDLFNSNYGQNLLTLEELKQLTHLPSPQ